jgi:carboxylesterase
MDILPQNDKGNFLANQNSHNNFMGGGEPFFIDKGSEVAILLLHGFTNTPYQLRDLAEFLSSKNLTVYSPVLAGHGTSVEDLKKSTEHDWRDSAEKALLFLKQKAKSIIVIGNSFGGNLALHLAAKYNNPLTGVISLGAPIKMKYHKTILLRVYTYGLIKKNYRIPTRNYHTNYGTKDGIISYPLIPMKSIRDFFRFIRADTVPLLKNIQSPTLLIHADADPVVHPKSLQKLHEKIGSHYKKVHWLHSNQHNVMKTNFKDEVFNKIYTFINEIT